MPTFYRFLIYDRCVVKIQDIIEFSPAFILKTVIAEACFAIQKIYPDPFAVGGIGESFRDNARILQ
jgi:hypothetical protein